MSERKPARVPSPGTVIRRELEARGWTQKDLAEIMARPPQTISQIIQGKKRITPETALQLAAAFGTSAQFWINLETSYRLYNEQKEFDQHDIVLRSKLYSCAPVAELLRRNWINTTGSIQDLIEQVCSFMGISNLDEHPELVANFRQAENRDPEIIAQVAWLQRIKKLVSKQKVGDYDPEKVSSSIPSLVDLSNSEDTIARVPIYLNEIGIHFVVVPHLPHTYLDGAAFYYQNRPVIALTLRYNRIDSFWFTLLHELAHIVAKHPSEIYLDNLDEPDLDDIEKEANMIATNWLVDAELFANFVQSTKPYFSKNKILSFAEKTNRHPGIIVGRLQYERIIPYKNLRGWLIKIDPHLEPWIDSPGPCGI
ncbi:MAG: HigA family addiction module antidote protein [Anaerolineales bacterium]|nr:HigA family addiction module antidote protein [Anaerolineales bacterium]